MKINNILVPVDFSGCSKNALKIAVPIAKMTEAKIHMVNAVHINAPHPDITGGNIVETIMKDYENQVQESFRELESEVIELREVPHEADRFVSYLVDAIFTESTRKQIDLILMGTRSRHDNIEHLLGTRSSDIIESSEVPVLVIPENVTAFHPKKIGFATDLNEVRDQRKLEMLRWFAKTYKAEVLAFHVTDSPETLSFAEQKAIEELFGHFDGRTCSVRTVQAKSVTDGIRNFTKTHELDLLAMMPRKHNLFHRLFKKSITKSIAIDLDVPLLTFQE